ncbi:MAG TPA: hypothetical protein VGJ84_07930 [Polyangiaceae bacterium]
MVSPARRQAVRVAVEASPQEPGAFLMRPLPHGGKPPPGTHEALLVTLDSDTRWLAQR